jgi:hypothetical protein
VDQTLYISQSIPRGDLRLEDANYHQIVVYAITAILQPPPPTAEQNCRMGVGQQGAQSAWLSDSARGGMSIETEVMMPVVAVRHHRHLFDDTCRHRGVRCRSVLIARRGASAAPVRGIPFDLPPHMPKRRMWKRMSVVHVDPDLVRTTEDVDLLIGACRRSRSPGECSSRGIGTSFITITAYWSPPAASPPPCPLR